MGYQDSPIAVVDLCNSPKPQKAGAEESGWFSCEPYAHLEANLTVCGTGEVLSADPQDQPLVVFALVEALLNAPSYLLAVSGKGLTREGWFDAHESLFVGESRPSSSVSSFWLPKMTRGMALS